VPAKLKFLYIKNYIAPGFDYAKFIRACEVEQQKCYWQYEWFQNFQQLDEPTLPPHSGVTAIWTFWIYPGAAESEGRQKLA